ncbi:GtrA family protein [Microbacterium sp.]|uniref:GtrA family protein n=1 Tax=Microbacterium sp. TaxID=51671 RepID=UPI0025FB6851|nr:GtrA family protein [Microbacterium sp.]
MSPAFNLRRALFTGGRFLVVGAISTAIEIACFNVFVYAFGWDVVSAKVAASLIALINAYFGNREWTFRERARRSRIAEVALFVSTNALTTALGAAMVWAGVGLAGSLLGSAPGPLLVNTINMASIAIIVVVRFALYHWAVFREPAATTVDAG